MAERHINMMILTLMIDDAIADEIDSEYRQGSVEEISDMSNYTTGSLYGISRGRQGAVV